MHLFLWVFLSFPLSRSVHMFLSCQCVHVCSYHMCIGAYGGHKMVLDLPGAGIVDSYESPNRVVVPLTDEPSLQFLG